MTPEHRLGDAHAFQWDTLHVILEGTSPLELDGVGVRDRANAYEFLRHYGLDAERDDDRRNIQRIHQEALTFVRKYFLTVRDAGLDVPPSVAQPEDPADLLVLASQDERTPEARWACSLLRVMHTIHHADRAFRKDAFDEIRRQVFGPYRACLQVDDLGCPMLVRGDTRVHLEGVFFKEDKSRDSIILKLLHKASNVAQDIYDWLGIQLVTRTRVEALLAVRFLRMHNLVIFANIVPGRSINNLIDVDGFRRTYEELTAQYEAADDTDELWRLEHLTHESRDFGKLAATVQNPFSGPEYRSIQFTCRQLIRMPNPGRKPVDAIQEYLREHRDDERVVGLLDSLERIPMEKELAFFFPYEIQILDYENYLKTRMGQSSHAAYKKRQIQAARRRVLHGLL